MRPAVLPQLPLVLLYLALLRHLSHHLSRHLSLPIQAVSAVSVIR